MPGRQRHVHRVSLPRVDRFSRRARPIHRAQAKRAVKRAALRDCGRRCVYCGFGLEWEHATLDHVWPVAHGGTGDPGNLVSACGRCNRLKGDLLPYEFFARFPWAGINFLQFARTVNRALKRSARRAVSLACAAAA
ncbi:MAG: endonuclease [Gemmatimonadetes bacterium]|nr:endonuclease [Gemmatimonadota bacterium]